MNTMKTQVPKALPYALAVEMTRAEAVTRFQVEASANQRAFSSMGKLFRVIETSLTKKDKGIFPLLIKAGITKGTCSNASYAAKVFDLVEKKILTEAEYDKLSHADCWNICRVQTAKSARQLTAEEVVVVIRTSKEPDEELASLYESGVTLEEAATKQAKADAIKADADTTAKIKAVAEATEIAVIKAENEKLKAKVVEPTAPVQAKPEPAEQPENETAEPSEGVTLKSVLDALDAVELAFAELDEDNQKVITARIAELAEVVGLSLGKKNKVVTA